MVRRGDLRTVLRGGLGTEAEVLRGCPQPLVNKRLSSPSSSGPLGRESGGLLPLCCPVLSLCSTGVFSAPSLGRCSCRAWPVAWGSLTAWRARPPPSMWLCQGVGSWPGPEVQKPTVAAGQCHSGGEAAHTDPWQLSHRDGFVGKVAPSFPGLVWLVLEPPRVLPG